MAEREQEPFAGGMLQYSMNSHRWLGWGKTGIIFFLLKESAFDWNIGWYCKIKHHLLPNHHFYYSKTCTKTHFATTWSTMNRLPIHIHRRAEKARPATSKWDSISPGTLLCKLSKHNFQTNSVIRPTVNTISPVDNVAARCNHCSFPHAAMRFRRHTSIQNSNHTLIYWQKKQFQGLTYVHKSIWQS